jgi:Ca2+-binding RTX toxin-like protein
MAIIFGNNGDNSLQGTGGADTIFGLAGSDHLFGNGGDDVLIGGAGADVLQGDFGIDTASDADAGLGLRANFLPQYSPANTGDAAGDRYIGIGEAIGDTYSGIEIVVGSSFNDELLGDALANQLFGGGGGRQSCRSWRR